MADEKTLPTVTFWCGKRVDEMSPDEMRVTVREMGQYIETLRAEKHVEMKRTLNWMETAAAIKRAALR